MTFATFATLTLCRDVRTTEAAKAKANSAKPQKYEK